MTRDERQDISVQRWISKRNLGTIEAVTGFGKTRIATNAIKLLRRNDDTRKVVVVVPTIQLKSQWEEGLTQLGLMEHTEVFVINTLVKKDNLECAMLVLDEIHRYAAETFSRVFEVVRYSFVLGLTATLKRLDGKHELLNRYAPICDRITMAEAKRNEWLAPFKEYNLAVKMDEDSAEYYRKLRMNYGYYSGKFQSDFELMKKCSYADKPGISRGGFPYKPEVVRYAERLGWRGNSAITARANLEYNRTAPRGQKRSIWGNDDHPYSPKKLYVWALQGMRTMREMKEFVQNYPGKIEVAERLIRAFRNRKMITFCETISSVDELAARLGSMAVVYHSAMEGGEKTVRKYKEYKTEAGLEKWLANNPEWRRSEANGVFKAYTTVAKKISASEMRSEALRKITETRQVRVVCTAKALDQGFDYPGAEIAIIYARTSSPTQHIQRTGRVARKHIFDDGSEKKSLIINIYVEDTKDYQWLNKSQRNSAGAIWVESVEEILERELETTEVNN